ncbi:uncharacterized protein LOC126581164 [Anopheles aquasalis]|uniref:uncharacterized protein LOC126581164 n=1 Tax=Anopheles aquasalis TaxID=42839 RepID=UPI00215B6672|nr:uncharacterized protein LOC126581164 [Anopheles aquasalis]
MVRHRRPTKLMTFAGLVTLLVVVLASSGTSFAQQEQPTEDVAVESLAEDFDPASTGDPLLDDYVNCPPEEASIEQKFIDATLDEKQDVEVPKFEDFAPSVIDPDDGKRYRLPGMRPGPREPSVGSAPIIDEQQDVELQDMNENISLDNVRSLGTGEADSTEGSGDETEEIPQKDAIKDQPIPLIPVRVEGQFVEKNEEDQEVEEGPLKHLKAQTLYDLMDGETREHGLAKYFEQHPEEIILESPGYPNPYPNAVNDIRNFSVDSGRGVQITIHDLDLNPTTDFLYIRPGNLDDENEKGPVLTGTYVEPIRFLIPETTYFVIHFVAQQEPDAEQKHRGFRLSYAPFGELNSPTTPTTTEVIVPQEELQWTTKELVITSAMMEMQSTWSTIKDALSNASNLYIAKHNLSYMPSRSFDVKLLARKCPDTWRNYESCIRLEFAVPLRPIFYEPEDDDEGLVFGFGNKFLQKGFISISTTEATEPSYELTVERLDEMWDEFGQMELQRSGIEPYVMPENGRILLTWIAISLAIVGTFIFILYTIWKIDIFQDYRRVSRNSHGISIEDDKNELKKKEFDISMFPSPHQVVPTFFPTGDPYNPAESEAQYAYDNATMSGWPEDFNDPRYPETSFSTNNPRTNQHPNVARPYEPISPSDFTPSPSAPMDFNGSPRLMRPSVGNRNNPFLSPREGPRTPAGIPPPPLPPPGMR